MAFDEVRLPTGIERGAVGGPGFLTNVVMLNSGKEQRNSLWSVDRGQWDIGYGIQSRADALIVRDFFMARLGRARGFRFKDWANYTTGTTYMPTSETGVGSDASFQLRYRYSDVEGYYYEKGIFKPVSETIRMFVNGAENFAFTVDPVTGLVSFTSTPAFGAVVTWLGEFDLPVRFDSDRLGIVVTTKEVLSTPSIPIIELKL